MRKPIVIASAVIFIYGMLASMLGTIVPGLGSRLALSNVDLSWLALAQGLGLAATSVWAGALMDRRGCKRGIVLGLIAAFAGLAILAYPSSFALSIAAMALLGVGGSLVIVGANALVNETSTGNQASALNILNLFVGLGGMTTPFLAANLLHSDPSRIALCGIGIALFALVLTLRAPILKPAAPISPIPTATERPHRPGAGLFGAPPLYILSTITFLYTACEFAMWNWLPKFLIASGVPTVSALNILSLGFACGMLLGRLGAAKLVRRFSPKAVTMTCAVVMCATTLSILHASGATEFAVLVFLAGIAMAPVFPTTIAIVGRVFQERSATAIGFAITCGFSGLVVSSPVIGALAGSSPHGLGRALLLIPVLSALIAAILVMFRKPLTAQLQCT